MREYDITHEARFDAEPHNVFQAVIDEGTGKAHWWRPVLDMRTGGAAEVGATVEVKVATFPPGRWAGRVAERVEDRLLRFEYTEGDFVGEGVWTFERVDGQTLLRFRWHVRPNRLAVRLALPFMNLRGSHSKVMKQGFENLRTYLKAREAVG